MTTNVKKVFLPLISLLEENANKKVKDLMPIILELVESKKSLETTKKDNDGNVTHIFCYYHKEWEAVNEVEFGRKKHSASGFNSMCKVGVNQWTKQQRVFKQAKENLLDQVANSEVTIEELPKLIKNLEIARDEIIPLG